MHFLGLQPQTQLYLCEAEICDTRPIAYEVERSKCAKDSVTDALDRVAWSGTTLKTTHQRLSTNVCSKTTVDALACVARKNESALDRPLIRSSSTMWLKGGTISIAICQPLCGKLNVLHVLQSEKAS